MEALAHDQQAPESTGLLQQQVHLLRTAAAVEAQRRPAMCAAAEYGGVRKRGQIAVPVVVVGVGVVDADDGIAAGRLAKASVSGPATETESVAFDRNSWSDYSIHLDPSFLAGHLRRIRASDSGSAAVSPIANHDFASLARKPRQILIASSHGMEQAGRCRPAMWCNRGGRKDRSKLFVQQDDSGRLQPGLAEIVSGEGRKMGDLQQRSPAGRRKSVEKDIRAAHSAGCFVDW